MAEREPIRVLDLFSGKGMLLESLLKRFTNRPIQYVAIDRDFRPGRVYGPQNVDPRISMSFHEALLRLDSPGELERTLAPILKDTRFDEIHLHMPEGTHPNSQGPLALRKIANYLKPGGRFYHVSDLINTPFVERELDFMPDGYERDIFDNNRRKVRQSVEKAGLVLDKYGHKAGNYHWFSISTDNPGLYSKRRDARQVVGVPYTSWEEDAFHFFIAHKPKIKEPTT